MKRFPVALSLLMLPLAAQAQDRPPPSECALVSTLLVSQDQGTVTFACSGITSEFGGQLAILLTHILKQRLDPQAVLAKLDDIEAAPASGVARALDEKQRQTLIKALVGKPAHRIVIAADPAVGDGGDYAKGIAQPLMMVGWQIEGNQITRKALPGLDQIRGVALIVRDRDAAPAKARELKAALAAARIVAPIMADPSLPPDAVILWIGKRPIATRSEPKS